MTTQQPSPPRAGDQIRKLVRDHFANEAPPDRLSIIDLTLRRATSSYEALDLLARHDYSIEALVLSRTLFEDVVTAYWVETHPNPAKVGARFGEHKTQALEALVSRLAPGTIETQAVSPELASWMGEPIDPWQSWTGKRLKQLLDDLDARREDEDWRERVQKLREMRLSYYSLSNWLVHTTPLGLELQEPLSDGKRFDEIARSLSLEFAYASYLLLAILVIEKEADERELREFGHVELVATAINTMLTGASPASNGGAQSPLATKNLLAGVKGVGNPQHFLAGGQGPLPQDFNGRPRNGDYVFSSGDLVEDLTHNFFLETGAATTS